jgi:hypothetical protein
MVVIHDLGLIAAKALGEASRLAQLNIPYQWGGNGPDRFDCSGFVQWCYSVGGYPNLPKDRRLWTTATLRLLGDAIPPGSQSPGDLIFPDAGHVGICVDKTRFIDAPETGKTVGIHDFTRYNGGKYSVRRLVDPYGGPDALVAGALFNPTTGVFSRVDDPIQAVQAIYDAIAKPIAWLSEGSNWIRIGMIVGGGGLVMFAIIHLENG